MPAMAENWLARRVLQGGGMSFKREEEYSKAGNRQ